MRLLAGARDDARHDGLAMRVHAAPGRRARRFVDGAAEPRLPA
jgi:hypothetical protein